MYLRGYQPGDLTTLFALDRLCFEPPFRFSRGAMRQFAESRNALVLLACGRGPEAVAEEPETRVPETEEPEQLLGFVIVHLEATARGLTGYVVTLDVTPASRRQGVAERLMRSIEAAAAEAGAHEMTLHVFGGNAGAVRLYERLGYLYASTANDFYGRGLQALVYRKRLPDELLRGQTGQMEDGSERNAEAAGADGSRERSSSIRRSAS